MYVVSPSDNLSLGLRVKTPLNIEASVEINGTLSISINVFTIGVGQRGGNNSCE